MKQRPRIYCPWRRPTVDGRPARHRRARRNRPWRRPRCRRPPSPCAGHHPAAATVHPPALRRRSCALNGRGHRRPAGPHCGADAHLGGGAGQALCTPGSRRRPGRRYLRSTGPILPRAGCRRPRSRPPHRAGGCSRPQRDRGTASTRAVCAWQDVAAGGAGCGPHSCGQRSGVGRLAGSAGGGPVRRLPGIGRGLGRTRSVVNDNAVSLT